MVTGFQVRPAAPVGAGFGMTLSDPYAVTPQNPSGALNTGVSCVWAKSSDRGNSWTSIAGATSAKYTPAAADVGATLRAMASYTDLEGLNKSANSVSAAAVSNPAPVFASDTVTLSVAENAAGGTDVGSPVTATDGRHGFLQPEPHGRGHY